MSMEITYLYERVAQLERQIAELTDLMRLNSSSAAVIGYGCHGMELNLELPNTETTAVAGYDGPFCVQLAANAENPAITELAVCNPSANPSYPQAGEVELASGSGITVATTHLPLMPGYVYLQIQLRQNRLYAEFAQSATRLSSSANTEYVQLAQVSSDDYGFTQISQIWRSGNVRINYRWW